MYKIVQILVMATSLREDDMERLLARVDQQSALISMLKERADKVQEELSQCQSMYDSSQNQVTKLQDMLSELSGEKALLESRFHTLAANHEQMIRIKDEYKEEISRLSKKDKMESSTMELLQRELLETKNDRDSLDKRCILLEHRIHELESVMDAERRDHKHTIDELNSRHSNDINISRITVEGLQHTVKQVSDKCENKSKQVSELQKSLERLQLSLSSLEVTKQEHTSTIKSLEDQLAQAKLELEQTKRLHREELSRDSCISKLRKELLESQQKVSILEEEYSAFKTHSNHLLTSERELNNKLRHLLD